MILANDKMKKFLYSDDINNVQELINNNDFYKVYSLADLRWGRSVNDQLTQMFWDADIHPEKYMDELPKHFLPKDCSSFVIPDNVICIGRKAFEGCDSLTSITIPSSVQSIGFGAFWGCRSLTSITIPNSVTNIEDFVFNFLSELIYKGTKQQFRETELTRKRKWRNGNPLLVKCNDGDIQLK